ncbi:MAG TPA: PDZ domain-containing protein, partial [Thermomicrobiales bacterium]|nr:PDZ domain-containing protein [Thermomicrobiales bacterium]
IDDRLAGSTSLRGSTTIAEGVRYAVPAPLVARVVGDLMRQGHVDYPYLGVTVAPATDEPAGPVRVAAAISGGPAADAGIEAGDVLVGLDGRRFGPDAPASVTLLAHAPGDRVRIELRRDGRDQTVEATLGTKPER